MEWYLKVLKNYVVFSGRARRKEYWMFILINAIIAIIIMGIGQQIGTYGFILSLIYSLAILLPSLAVSVRRLHDIGKSGWMILITLIPIIGGIWFLILTIKEGEKGANQYGEDPKAEVC